MRKVILFFAGILFLSYSYGQSLASNVLFPSNNTFGVIGTEESRPDNPTDNIFHVQINEKLNASDKVWLIYDLDGVEDHTCISRSINDQLSIGGYLAKKRVGYLEQRERISSAWLRQGDNIIRFTLPSEALHYYKIRNLRIEIEQQVFEKPVGSELIIETANYKDQVYFKGFISEQATGKLFIDGIETKIYNGEFENIIQGKNGNVFIKAVLENGQQLSREITLENPKSLDFQFAFLKPQENTSRLFNTEETSEISLNNTSLTVFSGALKNNTTISITPLREIDIPALDAGMVNVTGSAEGYRLLPDRSTFNKELILEMGYDPAKIPDGYTVKDIRTYYFDDAAHHWVALPYDSSDSENYRIHARTNHFTDFINAIIKTPESPEADAYNPTSMKNIQTVSPTEGINLIDPPSATNTGTAGISYPLNIPSGRNGIEPQLGAAYSNGGGNGWMGLGWNLQMPFITIETRWGVPRYSTSEETETYLLNGEQLTPLAHRSNLEARTSEKQFYERVEGSFNKIIRHGTSPKNYWWEVIDKTGTRHFYGGRPEGGLNLTAVLTDEYGNIARWCLLEIRDLNGNNVRYQYNTVLDKGMLSGSVNGKQIYISKINYTGFGASDGKYAIEFTTNRMLNEARRKDVIISGTLGFKEVTADLLRKITVRFNNQTIRSYELVYREGAFLKTLLYKIKEFDAAGNFFNEHEFDYYDDVRNGGTYQPFGQDETWDPKNDDVHGSFVLPNLGEFNDKASALNGTKSLDGGFGMVVTVGPNDLKLWSKTLTVGGSFGFSKATSEGILTMVDLNGDGLPDKVMMKKVGGTEKIFYRPNLSGTSDSKEFGQDDIEITGISGFLKDKSTSWNVGVQANGPKLGPISAFAGLSHDKTTTKTSIFFTDANGDQLIDVVVDKKVLFNRLDANGVPTFSASSQGTPSPIFEGGVINPGLFEFNEAEFEEAVDKNPLHDMVRMWEAPYDGVVSIDAPVALIQNNTPERQTASADGIRVAIQHKDTELWSTVITEDNYLPQTPQNVSSVTVQKGDRIYFRVQSRFNGEYDLVQWNPKVEYTNYNNSKVDANGRKIYSFKASEDFLLSAPGEVGLPITGQIQLKGIFSKPVTSDNVHAEIKTVSGTVLWERHYNWDEAVNETYDIPSNVTGGDGLRFTATSETNIAWSSVKWDNHVYYTISNDPNVTQVTTHDGKPLIEFYPTPNFSIFAEPVTAPHTWRAPQDGNATISPLFKFITQEAEGDIIFSVKHQNKLIQKKTLTIAESKITNTDSLIQVPVTFLDELYIEFHTESKELAEAIRESNVRVKFERTEEIATDPIGTAVNWNAPDNGTAYITPMLQFSGAPTGKIKLSATRQNNEVEDFTYEIESGVIPDDTLKVSTDSLEQFLLKYELVGNGLEDKIISSKAKIYFVSIDTLNAARHLLVQDPTFGPFYRQWGHFAYNGNRARADAPINQGDLHLDDGFEQGKDVDLFGNNDFDQLQNSANSQPVYDPAKAKFIFLVPNAKDKLWLGYDELTYMKASTMSSSRMGLDDLTQENPLPSGNGGSGLSAITKISKNNTTSFAIGAGTSGGFSVSGNLSASFGNSKVTADYIDMNGDRHPDILTEDKIQYSSPLGGMSNLIYQHNNGSNHRSENDALGVTLGGNFVVAESKNTTGESNNKETHVGGGKVSVGVSGSASYARSNDETEHAWMDINGDGLPDYVYISDNDLFVRLNLGYSFAPDEKWDVGFVSEGKSESISGGLGFGVNIDNGSISAGFGLSRSDNKSKKSLQDVNGDGLSDLLEDNGSVISVYLNTGGGFAAAINWTGAEDVSFGSSTTESANVGFTFCIPIIAIKACINPSFNVGQGASKVRQQISDVNGDGYPDYLTSDQDNNLTVKRATIGRTNMLRSVKRPLGASFNMDYKREGNTYNLPNDVWTLSMVEVHDGFNGDGVDKMKFTFAYEDGFYDRHEREFYGFRKVHTKNHDAANNGAVYRQLTQEFENRNYYEKGLPIRETVMDKDGNLYTENKSVYTPHDAISGNILLPSSLNNSSASIFPALTETENLFYEGQSQAGKSTRMTYLYDRYGNVVEYNDFADAGSNDDIKAVVSYHENTANYLVGLPKSIIVSGNGGKVYRKRSSIIDLNTGTITNIKQYLEDGTSSSYDMEYNSFGNLAKITRPTNAEGKRLSLQYTYDPQINTFVVKVQNSYGYTSEKEYDLRFGQMLKSKDINGNEITYQLDNVGRITQITGPYEQQGNGYTLKFAYHPDATVPWALTEHFDPQFPNNSLQTALFVDGLGRTLQVKKDGSIFTAENSSDQEVVIVSGRVLFDGLGRTTDSYYPVTESAGNIGVFNPAFDNIPPTKTEYDVLNRPLKVTVPDGAASQINFGFDADRDGIIQFSTKITDLNGKQSEQFTDIQGNVTATKSQNNGSPVWVSFVYNAINELTASTDDLGYTTTHEYDMHGRKIKYVHPDAGEITYQYDFAGNVTAVQTANLKQTGGQITYKYDFERLTKIIYPNNPEANVTFHYGENGSPYNRVGKVVIQEDATGGQEFFYGKLGETLKNIRTISIPGHDELTFTTEWKFDTWNRITEMIYPDGEKLTYAYNSGGILQSMKGEKGGVTYKYLDQLGYDKFEQRVFLAYGNGTKTTYNYEGARRRLQNMTAQTANNRLFIDNHYTYDNVSNILSLENKASVPSPNLMGGSSIYNYEYDDLYRLTKAEGSYTGSNHEHRYNLTMEYNTVGGIIKKDQTHDRTSTGGTANWVSQKKTTYTLNYEYGDANHAHAPTHIGDKTYTYDANGNQTGWDHDVSGQRRRMVWDEENRLRALSDNGSTSHYIYDAQGIRVLKSHGGGQNVHLNAKPAGGNGGGIGNFTVYVNPYLVLKSGSYTKHFYIEDQRIVSKLGESANLGKSSITAGNGKVNYVEKRGKTWEGIVKNLKFLGEDGQILTAGNSGKVPPGQIKGSGSNNEQFRYFYHPDHVGNTSYITDASGEVYQHLEYFAFGETFVEEHSNTNRTPYLFNGKELDEETGLYYFGARYYDPVTSIWVSVDPLIKPYESPYAAFSNSPIVFIDAFGLTPKKPPLIDRIKVFFGIGHFAGKKIRRNGKVVADNRQWKPDAKGGNPNNDKETQQATPEKVNPEKDPEPKEEPHEMPTFKPKEFNGTAFEYKKEIKRIEIPPRNIPELPCVPQNFNLNFNWVLNRAVPQSNAVAMNQLQRIANQWLACNNYSQVAITITTPAPPGGAWLNNLMFNRAQWIQNRLMGMGIPAGAFLNPTGTRRLFVNYTGNPAVTPSATVNIR